MANKRETTPGKPSSPSTESFWRRNRRELKFLIVFALLLGGGFTLISLNWVNDHVIEPFTGGIATVSGATLDLMGQNVTQPPLRGEHQERL